LARAREFEYYLGRQSTAFANGHTIFAKKISEGSKDPSKKRKKTLPEEPRAYVNAIHANNHALFMKRSSIHRERFTVTIERGTTENNVVFIVFLEN
jgi:hypothetical protein